MKRWITLATLAATLATAAPGLATDIPLTTQSSVGKPSNPRPLLGRGGIFLPWLNRHGTSSNKDSGIAHRGAQRHGYGFAGTNALGTRTNRGAGNVIPNNRAASRNVR
jgi:hypothetical protein